MSPAHVLEPTYDRLRRGLKDGLWPQGAKLEALRLADAFGVSMTPVRDSLNQLVGEGLVEMTPGEGFRVPRVGERTCRELFEITDLLLRHAVASRRPGRRRDPSPAAFENYPDRVANVFAQLAIGSGNTVLAATVRSLNARLHRIRAIEPLLFPESGHDIEAIDRQARRPGEECAEMIRAYHARRLDRVVDLVALCTEHDPPVG